LYIDCACLSDVVDDSVSWRLYPEVEINAADYFGLRACYFAWQVACMLDDAFQVISWN